MKRAVLTAILAILPEKKRGASGKKALIRTIKMVNCQFRKGENAKNIFNNFSDGFDAGGSGETSKRS